MECCGCFKAINKNKEKGNAGGKKVNEYKPI